MRVVALYFSFFLLGAACVVQADVPAAPLCGTRSLQFSQASPVLIPLTPLEGISPLIVAAAPSYLWDVDVRVDIDHQRNGELSFSLISPLGTEIALSDKNGGVIGGIFSGITFDDQADPGGGLPYNSNSGIITDHIFENQVFAQSLTPEEPLGAFRGENPNGIWTLKLQDSTPATLGILRSWSIEIAAFEGNPSISLPRTFSNSSSVAIPDAIDAPPLQSFIQVSELSGSLCDVDLFTSITHSYSADLDITVTSPAGKSVTLTTDNGSSLDDVFKGTMWSDSARKESLSGTSLRVTEYPFTDGVAAPLLSPEEPLSALIGDSPNGLWTLSIDDDAGSGIDAGTLDSWSLMLTTCGEEQDFDQDGFPDSCDQCPDDSNKYEKGICGCHISDLDSDGDGASDCQDRCPSDPFKASLGICGCGVSDVDSSSKGFPDCLINSEIETRLLKLRSLIELLVPKGKNGRTRHSMIIVSTEIRKMLRTSSALVQVQAGVSLKTIEKNMASQVKPLVRYKGRISKRKKERALIAVGSFIKSLSL